MFIKRQLPLGLATMEDIRDYLLSEPLRFNFTTPTPVSKVKNKRLISPIKLNFGHRIKIYEK